jgi:hypothetical protein
MTNNQYEMTMVIAAGMSVAIAFTDFIIVQVKRHRARQRAESLPVGTTIIIKKPWPPAAEDGRPTDSVFAPDILPSVEP